MTETRLPGLYEILTGEAANNVEAARRRALEDLQFAQHKRQTQAAHAAYRKARALTCDALRLGQ
jgi:hypothetical protein